MGDTRYERLHSIMGPRYNKNPLPQELKSRQQVQTAFLEKQFGEVVKRTYYDKTAIEADRRQALIDYQTMEWHPIISSALNIIAREIATVNRKGSVINIYSNKRIIKDELEHLFHKVLNINVTLKYWAREMVKNGDCFQLMLFKEDQGVVDTKFLQKYLEREEKIEDNRLIVQFKDIVTGQVFTQEQVAHFRLMGDMERLPYGQSILEKVRKTHKMLIVAEDAMMIKRLTRSTQRLLYKIDVGNMDDNDVESYVQAIAAGFKREANVDPRTGQVDYKFGINDVTQDYFIPVRNGASSTSVEAVNATDNTDQIADIEYLKDLLLSGLEVPKPFLNFAENTGDGKNMAMIDMRFAKMIVEYQQCMLLELNKIAQIHLFLRGYDEDYENFRLELNNPSVQDEILMIENLSNKLNAYTSAVTPDEATQIAPMSQLTAKRLILGMTDHEIIEDLKQQMFEKALGEEYRQKFTQIDASSVFADLMQKFRKPEGEQEKPKKDNEGQGGDNPFSAGNEPEKGGQEPTENPFESRHIRMRGLDKMRLLKEQIEKYKI